MLAATRCRLLEHEVLLRLRVVADRLAVEDQRPVIELFGRGHELDEHQAEVLQVPREDADVGAILVNLDSNSVVLRLHDNAAQLLDHGFWIGQALCQLRANRPADRYLQSRDTVLAFGPEGLRDQPEVRGSVVGSFQSWTQRAVALLGKGERLEYGRVADPKSQAAKSHPHEMLGRSRVEVAQQRGKQCSFPLDRAWPHRRRDLHQPGVGLGDRRRFRCRPGRKSLGYKAEVAQRVEKRADLCARAGRGLSDRRHHELFAHPDLDRLEEWDQAPLDQIRHGLDLVGRCFRVELSQRLDELIAAARGFHPVEIGGHFREPHLIERR